MTEELKEFGSSKNNLWPGRDFTLRKTGLNPAPLRASQLAMLPICAALPPLLIQGVGSAMCSSPPPEIMGAIGVLHSAKLLKQ